MSSTRTHRTAECSVFVCGRADYKHRDKRGGGEAGRRGGRGEGGGGERERASERRRSERQRQRETERNTETDREQVSVRERERERESESKREATGLGECEADGCIDNGPLYRLIAAELHLEAAPAREI